MIKNKKYIRDIILAVFLLAICGVALLLWHGTAEEGYLAVVTVDGREIARYPLSEETETVIDGVGGKNKLVISAGAADMTEADCPDKVCVDHRRISNVGETIVCLPHKVVVRITGENDSGMDVAA